MSAQHRQIKQYLRELQFVRDLLKQLEEKTHQEHVLLQLGVATPPAFD